ncbi:hypothetical protein M422DRAFT_227581 [Sphaerobolus stellatus SS14]|uniref:Dihydrolipoamide acetyltransferase component of pyruvate dehydrogenase complex n=1 Tax=Sphaerobolus stellatus (strain SS14) TaxID=990650 RepID=A0A0C9W0S2_SPHS4|nr:hypothetical protein M422DRAFT_227581 [Sphaerobolus stellatus SS14]
MLSRRSIFVATRRSLYASFHSSPARLAKRKVIQQFRLADIGEGITECEVIKWNVKLHATVQSFDPLCEVQSDKASVEITSPFDGIVTELLVKEGDVAKVGEGLCLIETEEEHDADVPEEKSSSEPIIEAPLVEKSQHAPNRPSSKPHPLDPSYPPAKPRADVLATPSVRHFARQKGVDLTLLTSGSGKGGRFEKRDVEAFLTAKAEPPIAEDQEVELGRTRFAMWKAMTKSLEIPHFGYSTTLDITKVTEMLPILNAHIPSIYRPAPDSTSPPSVSPYSILPNPYPTPQSDLTTHFSRLTVLPLLLKTLSRAMQEWPLFRSSISSVPDPSSKQKPTITIRPHADISIALSTPTGLYTPTLTGVDTMNAYQIMGRLRRMQALGRQVPCALGLSEMPKRGGTLTVSNVGAIGQGEYASPVLVPGGGIAIVAIGRAKWVDVVPQDGVGPTKRRLQVGISWSADHRVVEGAELAAFVETWRSWAEHPERLIGEGI